MDTYIEHKFVDSLKKEVKSIKDKLIKKDKSEVLAVEFDTKNDIISCRILIDSYSMYRNYLCDKVYRLSVSQILAYANN